MNLRKLVQTISYVTSIPIGTSSSTDNDSYKGLAKYLPWAGLLIALMLAGLAYLLKLVTGTSILIGTILAILWLCVTGGIHMDGLMDTADGVFSHQPKEKMLEIMQDPRVGNFGVLTGIVVFMAKLAALVSVSSNLKALIPLLIIVPIASRWCELFAIGKFNYAKEAGTGKVWHDTTKFPTDLFFGIAPLIVACVALMFLASVKLVLAAAFLTIAAGVFASYRLNEILQGHTGDSYGAVVEIAEALGLLVCAVLIKYLV